MHRWNPWADLDAVRADMDRLLRETLARKGRAPEQGFVWTPAADVAETPGAYLIRIELPGLELADVRLEVDGRDLLVSGERRPECDCQGAVYQILERLHGPFARAFLLPADADAGAVAASLKNGLLTITVPRCLRSPQGRCVPLE